MWFVIHEGLLTPLCSHPHDGTAWGTFPCQPVVALLAGYCRLVTGPERDDRSLFVASVSVAKPTNSSL